MSERKREREKVRSTHGFMLEPQHGNHRHMLGPPGTHQQDTAVSRAAEFY